MTDPMDSMDSADSDEEILREGDFRSGVKASKYSRSAPPFVPFIDSSMKLDGAIPEGTDMSTRTSESVAMAAKITALAGPPDQTAQKAHGNDPIRKTRRGITLHRSIRIIEYLQKPYKDVQLQRHEGAVRRNWAIQTAIGVREFFMFAEQSELVVELPSLESQNLNENDKQELLDKLKEETAGSKYDINAIIKKAHKRDADLNLLKALKTAYWQCLVFGDAYILKLFSDVVSEAENKEKARSTDPDEIMRLYPINSRRVHELIVDPDNFMSVEGAWIDGQALDKSALLHFHYQANQFSPHTENYGYTPLETVLNLAEGLNIFYEEDIKEIQRSAWLSSILLNINTAGLSRGQARTRIKNIVDEIDPGKIIGVGGQGDKMDAQPIELKSDLNGLAAIGENQEAKIFKAFRVPQFLVQSEDIANRSTADKAAELFLSGVIEADQTWLADALNDQWYDPFLRKELGLKETDPLPFRIRRDFKIPTVSEFVDLADGLQKLLASGIWDVEQANKKLGTPEIADRMAENENQMGEMPGGMPGQPGQQGMPGQPGQPPQAPQAPQAPKPPGQPGQQGQPGQPNWNQAQPAQVTSGGKPLGEAIKGGGKDKEKDKKAAAAAFSSIAYTKSVKPRFRSANELSALIKTRKLEMLENLNARLKEKESGEREDKGKEGKEE